MKQPPVSSRLPARTGPAVAWALYLALAALAVGAAVALLLARYVVAALLIATPAAVWFSLCFAESHYVLMTLAAWRDRGAGGGSARPVAAAAAPLAPRAAVAVAVALGVVVGGADALLPHLNLAILHVLALLLYLFLARRKAPVGLTVLLVGLAYVGYFLKPLGAGIPDADRLVNRTFVAAVLVALSAAAPWLLRPPAPGAPRHRRPRSAAARLDRALACLAGACLLAAILAVDLRAPDCYNLPILFVLPLALGAWGSSARLPWLLALVGAAGGCLDKVLAPHAPALPPFLWVNRLLALGVALGLLLLLRAWLRPARVR